MDQGQGRTRAWSRKKAAWSREDHSRPDMKGAEDCVLSAVVEVMVSLRKDGELSGGR